MMYHSMTSRHQLNRKCISLTLYEGMQSSRRHRHHTHYTVSYLLTGNIFLSLYFALVKCHVVHFIYSAYHPYRSTQPGYPAMGDDMAYGVGVWFEVNMSHI